MPKYLVAQIIIPIAALTTVLYFLSAVYPNNFAKIVAFLLVLFIFLSFSYSLIEFTFLKLVRKKIIRDKREALKITLTHGLKIALVIIVIIILKISISKILGR